MFCLNRTVFLSMSPYSSIFLLKINVFLIDRENMLTDIRLSYDRDEMLDSLFEECVIN